MNNLVSKNPVQRFKEERKVIFAQKGMSFKQAWNDARAKNKDILIGQIIKE